MKKLLKIFISLVVIIVVLLAIDFISIFYFQKPLLILDKREDSMNEVYKGVFWDVYNCASYSSFQVKFKWNKFDCPKTVEVNKEENIDSKKIAKLTLVGDLLFEQPFYNAIHNGDNKDEYFSLVKKYFIEDDLSIGNMEVVIGNENLKVSGEGYNFCAPEYVGHLVNTLDFEVLGTANNHAYDRGYDGLKSTLDFFENNTDILTVGTFKNIEEKNNLNILEINDIKFGFLAYTYGTNQTILEKDKELISYYKSPVTRMLDEEYKNILKSDIEKLDKKVDVVIVLMHWGNEFTYKTNNEQKTIAKFLNELGVDIIVGSHSHSIQPIEIIGEENKTLVYYSLGNFVSADDDIARTKPGDEEFDNAYQVGLLSNLNVIKEDDVITFDNIETELMINYFDNKMRNFKIIPYSEYNDDYEKTHYRYNKGLNKEFISNINETVLDNDYIFKKDILS